MFALLAAAVAWQSVFATVPGFDGVRITRIAGGRDRLFVVIREAEREPEYHDELVRNWAVPGALLRRRLVIVHLPGLEREDVTSRLLRPDDRIVQLFWDAAREELGVGSERDDGFVVYSGDLQFKRRFNVFNSPSEPYLDEDNQITDAVERAGFRGMDWITARSGRIGVTAPFNGPAYLVNLPGGRVREVFLPFVPPYGGVGSIAIGDCAAYLGTLAGQLVRVDLRSGKSRRLLNRSSSTHYIQAVAATLGMVFVATNDLGLYVAPERSLTSAKDPKCP